MSAADLVFLVTAWFLVHAVPGLMQSLGFFFGLLIAFWACDEYLGSG